MKTFYLSIPEILQHQKSRNLIYLDTNTAIRIGDIASYIITSEFINHAHGLQAPRYSPCVLDIEGRKTDACYTEDIYTDIVSMHFLTNFMPGNLQDISDYAENVTELIKEYLGCDVTNTILLRTQLSFLLSSIVMSVKDIILYKQESSYIDKGIILDVGYDYHITENSTRNFLTFVNYSDRKALLTYFKNKPPLVVDYEGFKISVRKKLNCDLYHCNDVFRLRCEYILRIIDTLMAYSKDTVWTKPSDL